MLQPPIVSISEEEMRKRINVRIERLELRKSILPKGDRWKNHERELNSKLNVEKRNLEALDKRALGSRGIE